MQASDLRRRYGASVPDFVRADQVRDALKLLGFDPAEVVRVEIGGIHTNGEEAVRVFVRIPDSDLDGAEGGIEFALIPLRQWSQS